MTDDLAEQRAKRERKTLAMIRESFEKAAEREDAAFYLRPESAWLLLEMAERAQADTVSHICLERTPKS